MKLSISAPQKGTPNPPYQHLKLVKRGFRGTTTPQLCGVSFEDSPAWIWAMRLSDWTTIYVTEEDELRMRQRYSSTLSFVKERISIIPHTRIQAMMGSVGVWFVSGSRSFLTGFVGPEGTPLIMWMEQSGRRRPQDSTRRKWFGVSHETVGGSTTARGVFGHEGLDDLKIPLDPLRRSLSHILKYSIRPKPCALPCADDHYLVGERLSVRHLNKPVVYETRFSRSGWGVRCLDEAELAQAFDLPSYLAWDPKFPTQTLPIQIFRVVVDAVLAEIRPTEQPGGGARLKTSIMVPDLDQSSVIDRIWLSSLRRWLPGSWANVEIADKAAKDDDAAINHYPWNQRISLVLAAATSTALRGFESLALRRWRNQLRASFLGYLTRVYGEGWAHEYVRFAWKKRRKRKVGVELPGASAKRRRLSCGGREAQHDEGGKGGERNRPRGGDRQRPFRETLSLEKGRLLVHDVSCGLRILAQVMRSTWWDWTFGSSLFFWRWNGLEQVNASRDGIPVFVVSSLPKQRRQKAPRLPSEQQVLVAEKLDGMVRRDYLEEGYVANSVHFFAVPKGVSDIRVVFDGTSSGLNETLWAPNFYLPSAKSAAMSMGFSTWMADMDFGEMFHNFQMDPTIRPFSGVELGALASKMTTVDSGRSRPTLLRWTRLFMGMRPSPYNAVRHYYWGEEFARGNPSRLKNPMGYDRVRLNLPGMQGYDPSLPKVMKWREDRPNRSKGQVAGDVVTFIDDVRVTGFSKENCWEVYRQFASRVQFLGMQNAPRKFRPPSQMNAGAWTGTIFRIGSSSITKSVSQEKWDKGRQMVSSVRDKIVTAANGRPWLNRRALEKEVGFLNHLSMTFETMIPFLKGFYLTLNSWRGGRDDQDWKVSPKRWKSILFERVANGLLTEAELDMALDSSTSADAPERVMGSPGLKQDVEALHYMFNPSVVPEVSIRSKSILTIVYGFGDASGSGLGATFTCGGGFNFRIGVWGSAEDPESSNWKEFTNIVESLEDEASSGNLAEAEVYMFTDNSTVESCASRGSSSSKKLLSLIVRLHGLMTRSGVKIHVFHVAGTRMIAQGTDGVSRGYMGQGVMAGDSMVAHIPVHISAVDRSPVNLVAWIRSWSSNDSCLLDERGWFETGHDIEGWRMDADGFERPILSVTGRTFIWSPPPLAAEVAIAELRKARIKRQNSFHIFVCPRLCTTQWAKQLYRSADLVFEVPVGFSCWPTTMHEPLLIGILFPFLRVRPWQIKGAPKMFAVGRELRSLLKDNEVESGRVLRKLWKLGGDLQSMPEHMVRQVLFFG